MIARRSARSIALACLTSVLGCRPNPATPDPAGAAAAPPAVRYEQHIFAGGKPPPAGVLAVPPPPTARAVREGEKLFASMNCDGCHGGGATGFLAPSLSDGRWRYGGSDPAVFQSIFYGRPQGMPAFGGVLTAELIWKLVAYLKSLPPPKSLPTESW